MWLKKTETHKYTMELIFYLDKTERKSHADDFKNTTGLRHPGAVAQLCSCSISLISSSIYFKRTRSCYSLITPNNI